MIVKLRPVEKNRRNARLILKWENAMRCDRSEARNQLTSHVIKWDEHREWFVNKSTPYYYFVCAGKREIKAGTVSLDFEKKASLYTCSILIAKPWRNKGIGTRALRAACRIVRSENPGAQIIAKIFSDNIPSIRCFARAGFKKIGEKKFKKKHLFILKF